MISGRSQLFAQLRAVTGPSPSLLYAAVGVAATLVCVRLIIGGLWGAITAAALVAIFLAISIYDKAAAATLTLGYLCVMGDLRRIVGLASEKQAVDPLLLVSPCVAFVLAVPLLLRVKTRDSFSKWMLLLTAVIFLEMLNPIQGGLSVSLAGFVYSGVPALWFWVGRRYADPSSIVRLLYRMFLPICVLAAAVGLYQNFIGFFPWEQAWIDDVKTTYIALYVGGKVRAFGFSVSSAEYATVLFMGGIVALAGVLKKSRMYALFLIPIVPALFLSSSRGSIFRFLAGVAAVWGLRRGRRLGLRAAINIGLPLACGLALIVVAASQFAPSGGATGTPQTASDAAISHQLSGLANPVSGSSSTAGAHVQMFLSGLWQGVIVPIGHGTGASMAGGDANEESGAFFSENDLSDAFINYGLVGGIVFVVFVCRTLYIVFRNTGDYPGVWSLALAGLFVSTVGGWLIGGQYGTTCILFYLAGSIAKQKDMEVGYSVSELTDEEAPPMLIRANRRSLGPV